jgi:aminoglycoside phosphotransferase (APT) family kinase protein
LIIRRDPPASLEFTEKTARSLSESFVENLARLHSLEYQSIGLGDLGKPEGYLERQVRGWTERYHGSRTHEFPEVERIVSWMQSHMPAPSGAALVHNDYKYDNLVLDPSDITKIIGVLDWEMCTIGDPLTDLGTALAYWTDADDPEPLQKIRWGPTTHPGSMTRAQLVERYAEKTGRNVAHMDFYVVFARFKVAVIVQQIYYRYHQGLTKDGRFAGMPVVVEALLRASLHCAETGAI